MHMPVSGVMPLDMPESVRVRFTGTMQPGITLRDLVHAIPYTAKQQGLLTVEKQGKVHHRMPLQISPTPRHTAQLLYTTSAGQVWQVCQVCQACQTCQACQVCQV